MSGYTVQNISAGPISIASQTSTSDDLYLEPGASGHLDHAPVLNTEMAAKVTVTAAADPDATDAVLAALDGDTTREGTLFTRLLEGINASGTRQTNLATAVRAGLTSTELVAWQAVFAADPPEVTATDLGDKAHAVNTTGKVKGRLAYNSTTDLMYYSLGTTDVAKWRPTSAATNASDVTPA